MCVMVDVHPHRGITVETTRATYDYMGAPVHQRLLPQVTNAFRLALDSFGLEIARFGLKPTR